MPPPRYATPPFDAVLPITIAADAPPLLAAIIAARRCAMTRDVTPKPRHGAAIRHDDADADSTTPNLLFGRSAISSLSSLSFFFATA